MVDGMEVNEELIFAGWKEIRKMAIFPGSERHGVGTVNTEDVLFW